MSDIFKANFGFLKLKIKNLVHSKHKIDIYTQIWEKQENLLWKVSISEIFGVFIFQSKLCW